MQTLRGLWEREAKHPVALAEWLARLAAEGKLESPEYVELRNGQPALLLRLVDRRLTGEAEAAPAVVAPPAGRTLASQPLGIELDRDRQRVYQHGRWVRLTPREFRLAACLFERRDTVVSHVELLKAMGKDYQEIDVKVLHTVVARVKDAFGWKDQPVIQNVHGVGYLFDSEAGG